jgi:hypothetical protein
MEDQQGFKNGPCNKSVSPDLKTRSENNATEMAMDGDVHCATTSHRQNVCEPGRLASLSGGDQNAAVPARQRSVGSTASQQNKTFRHGTEADVAICKHGSERQQGGQNVGDKGSTGDPCFSAHSGSAAQSGEAFSVRDMDPNTSSQVSTVFSMGLDSPWQMGNEDGNEDSNDAGLTEAKAVLTRSWPLGPARLTGVTRLRSMQDSFSGGSMPDKPQRAGGASSISSCESDHAQDGRYPEHRQADDADKCNVVNTVVHVCNGNGFLAGDGGINTYNDAYGEDYNAFMEGQGGVGDEDAFDNDKDYFKDGNDCWTELERNGSTSPKSKISAHNEHRSKNTAAAVSSSSAHVDIVCGAEAQSQQLIATRSASLYTLPPSSLPVPLTVPQSFTALSGAGWGVNMTSQASDMSRDSCVSLASSYHTAFNSESGSNYCSTASTPTGDSIMNHIALFNKTI